MGFTITTVVRFGGHIDTARYVAMRFITSSQDRYQIIFGGVIIGRIYAIFVYISMAVCVLCYRFQTVAFLFISIRIYCCCCRCRFFTNPFKSKLQKCSNYEKFDLKCTHNVCHTYIIKLTSLTCLKNSMAKSHSSSVLFAL